MTSCKLHKKCPENGVREDYWDENRPHRWGPRLYNALLCCDHKIESQWSGVKCVKCGGWFCL